MHLSPALIREARARAKLTQAQVCHQASISDGTYRRLEGGRGSCSAETLARVCGVLGVTMESVFEREREEVAA